MANETPPPIEDFSYEEAQAELNQIITKLEGEENTLENSLQLYERGQALVKYCADLLEKAELRIKKLVGDNLEDLE